MESEKLKEQRSHFELKVAKQAILEWLGSNAPIDRVLGETFREHKVGAQQRGVISHSVYSLVRFWPLWVDQPPKPENQGWLRQLDRALQQSLPGRKADPLQMHAESKPAFESDVVSHFRKLHGVPEFLLSSMAAAPKAWHLYFHQMFSEAPLTVRINPLKISTEEFLKRYESYEPRAADWVPGAFHFAKRWPIQRDEGFLSGLFEVQDEHSQLVSLAAAPKPGESVLDLCAGAGGKTLHLGALMENKGEIVVYDISKRKISDLMIRAKRAGLTNVRSADPAVLQRKFDLVVVDAPCSGLGTLRRSPDRLFKFQLSEAKRLQSLQWEIVKKALSYLKPGGRLVYATCTVRPEENTAIYNRILGESGFRPGDLRGLLKKALPRGAEFLTLAAETPAARMVIGVPEERGFLQWGPSSQTSGGLTGDGFFMGLVNWEG